VVLDLVVEPEVRVVVEVAAAAEVHRPDHLAHVELGLGRGPFIEAVEVVAGVVRAHHQERVPSR